MGVLRFVWILRVERGWTLVSGTEGHGGFLFVDFWQIWGGLG